MNRSQALARPECQAMNCSSMHHPPNKITNLSSPLKCSWSRRQFLAAGSAALLPLTSRRTLAASHHHVPEFRRPLPIPGVLSPVQRDETTDYYEIVQRETSLTCCQESVRESGAITAVSRPDDRSATRQGDGRDVHEPS